MKMMDILLQIGLVAVVSSFSAGCAGSSGSGAAGRDADSIQVAAGKRADGDLEALDPQFYVTHAPDGADGEYSLGFMVGAGGPGDSPGMRAIARLQTFIVRVYAPDGKLIDSISTSAIDRSGTSTKGNGSITAYSRIEWKAPAPVLPGSYARMSLPTDHGTITRRIDFPASGAAPANGRKPLVLSLDVQNRGSAEEFTLRVERISPAPAGEYLPSGEKYRIEIIGSSGETLWSSSGGMSFTQSVGTVDPAKVGQEVTYRARWDGRSALSHGRAEPGTYRIVATIPAKPAPYILREEFTWSGK